MAVVLHVQLRISIYLGKKGEELISKTFRQMFQEQISPSPSVGFGMSVSYYAIKYGRWFGAKAKAVNICGSWSSPQQLLQMSYSFSVPCCVWVLAVISWPKPRCQQTLQEDLLPASVELHKSFHETYQEAGIRGCGISSVCCSHERCLVCTFSCAAGEDAHLCNLPWVWHHLSPQKRSILGLTQKKLPRASCLSQGHRTYGCEDTRSSDSEEQRYYYTDIILIKQHPLHLWLQLMDAPVAMFKNVSHLFLGMPVQKT